MQIKDRYLNRIVLRDLKQKMVFVGGPRQVGKTTFARDIIGAGYRDPAYLNWDYRDDRLNMLNGVFPGGADILIFDEIHKYKRWKRLVKGIYDKKGGEFDIIVTGSARLDVYRRGGDSLLGRYHYFRLHPFSLAEVLGTVNSLAPLKDIEFVQSEKSAIELENLMKYGGFPETLITKDETGLRRWHNERIEKMFREDIRDITLVRDIGSMELLGSFMPQKAAGLLSLNAIREDLEVSHRAASSWIDILERFYYIYRIYPYASRKIRSLKKESKVYLWDWSEIDDRSRRFENLVAGHLLKLCHYLRDAEGYKIDLYYLRDVEGREVDFLVTAGQKPWFAVEVKSRDTAISKNLLYFGERLKIPYSYQVVLEPGIDQQRENIRFISADKFLSGLI
ncbi:MAG: ATP-binding protein [Candidatus Margulisbacteria bacterium]|nr:ATP-binding protein [Candidatus Margulisiibacteriota bacterium]